MKRVILMFITMFFISCSSTKFLSDADIAKNSYFKIENIPIKVQEEKNTCGVNALYMILNHWDRSITYDSVNSKFKKDKNKGISTVEMLLVAMNFKYDAEIKKLSYENLITKLELHIPVILLLEDEYFLSDNKIMDAVQERPKIYHFVVAMGFSKDKQEVLFLTGKERIEIFKKKDLISKWKETDYTSIIIPPNSK